MWAGTNSFWVVLTQELEVLAILKRVGGGAAKGIHSLKGGSESLTSPMRGGGGGGHKFWTGNFPIL